ncbi:hypothetical protein JCM10213v2_000780 [Rhodosporidiobolus nylandii]
MENQQASAALLRVLASLISHIDPVKGGKASAMRRAREELSEVVEELKGGLSQDVLVLLSSAGQILTSSDQPSLPFSAAVSAVSALSHAAELLVIAASPPHTPPFSRLPAELVARVVELCQVEDVRVRQNTNSALAATCRSLHAGVRPILEREVHLFRPGQLERVSPLFRSGMRKPEQLETLTVELDLDDLKLQPDGRFNGRHLHSLLSLVRDHVERFHLHLTPLRNPRPTARLTTDDNLNAAGLGEAWDRIIQRSQFRDVSLPRAYIESTRYHYSWIFCSAYNGIRRLRIGQSDQPQMDEPLNVPEAEGAAYERLALPWLAVSPRVLLHLLSLDNGEAGGTDPRASHITHLEVTLTFESTSGLEDRVAHIRRVFSRTPHLTHLTLRLRSSALPRPDAQSFARVLAHALCLCGELVHLEIGGTDFEDDFFPPVFKHSSLRTIVLLPTPHFAVGGLEDYLMIGEEATGSVRRLVYCPRDIELQGVGTSISTLAEMCEESGSSLYGR